MSKRVVTIRGLQQWQDRNLRAIAAFEPQGEMARTVKQAVTAGHRYAIAITHVDTGAWRASHRMKIEPSGLTGEIYVSPYAHNPRSRQAVHRYAEVWEERGGPLAVYERVEGEIGPDLERELGVKLERIL